MTATHTAARSTTRLVAGLALTDDARRLSGCVVSVDGRGFRARPRLAAVVEEDIPAHASRLIRSVCAGEPCDASTLLALGNELADLQARLLQQLLVKLPEDDPVILAASLSDYGWHRPAMPGEMHAPLTSFYEPVRLAELSGMNVVDDFLRRDVAAGGDGCGVLLSPLWLLQADRSTRREERHAGLLIYRNPDQTTIYYFPPHAVQGDALPPMAFLTMGQAVDMATSNASICKAVASRCLGDTPHWQRVKRVEVVCETDCETLISAVQESLPDVNVCELSLRGAAAGVSARHLYAAAAAVLAILHIDQAPANLPENSGDATPRVLGRLTPGSPVHWRRLLRMMAQHELPATTLNRAI